MVHRSSEDNNFAEESSFPRKFSSNLSRDNSYSDAGKTYYHSTAFIFYRPPSVDYFEGPFTELQCQFWYKQGFFYNALEFKLGSDAPIETLGSLKERNGRESPFLEGGRKSPPPAVSTELFTALLNRVANLAREIEEMKDDREALQVVHKLERDELQNQVKELVEKDSRNDRIRREAELRVNEMRVEIADLQEAFANLHVGTETTGETVTDEETTVLEVDRSVVNGTAPELRLEEDITPEVTSSEDIIEVRNELERLQNNVQSLDEFTFKLSHKIEKLRCKYKVVDIIGEGLNCADGVYDRLGYLEESVEQIQAAMISMEEGKTLMANTPIDGIVLPSERQQEGSIPDTWFSPSEKFVSESEVSLAPISFAAASQSIAAVATAAWPSLVSGDPTWAPVDLATVEKKMDDWESIDDDDDAPEQPWTGEGERVSPPSHEDTAVTTGEVDKENHGEKVEGGPDHLALLGNGLGLLLQRSTSECEDFATDSDTDRLLVAIKGAKMLQIAESLKQHFTKSMVCECCSTSEKKVELRNAIEYFEHLNRSHFKKCGGADRTLVNQFALLLDHFKAAVPVPISIAKRQYAEREKNKPWLKREAASPSTKKRK